MSAMNEPLFFGSPVKIARFDVQKYPILEKLTRQQISYAWVPEEVALMSDIKDFRALSDSEQHIFTSNIKRQIVLDTKQGTAPSLAFLPIASQPELETWIQTWAYFETIHSRSYTHIIRNIYSDPSEVFDHILDIPEIQDCATDIGEHYDNLIKHNAWNFDRQHTEPYEHKKALWMALNSVNILEGIRFYVSFACSWAFAEQKKSMEGNAKIIKFIARDENLHLAATQHILKILPKDDPDFIQIARDCRDDVVRLFDEVVEQECAWAKYLFKEGSMIGLNYDMLVSYIHWLANKRMTTLGLPTQYKGGTNPLPWTAKWIGGSDVQVAPQESELVSYTMGGVSKDVTAETFKGFSL